MDPVLQSSLFWMPWFFPNQTGTSPTIQSPFPNRLGDSNLIPRNILFGSPDYSRVLLSPDGRYISYLKKEEERTDVWVADLPFNVMEGGPLPVGRKMTNFVESRIVFQFWAFDNRSLLVCHDRNGDENYLLSKLDVETGTVTPMVEGNGIRVFPVKFTPFRPFEIAIEMNDRDPRFYDAYILDIRTGQRRLVLKNDRFTDLLFDFNLTLRLATEMVSGGGMEYYSFDDGGQYSFYRRVEAEDKITTQPLSFDSTGRVLYWLDSENRDLAVLVESDFITQEQTMLFSPVRADIMASDVTFHPVSEKPVLVEENYVRPEMTALDPTYQPDVQFLGTVSTGDISIGSTSDFSYWLVTYSQSDSPSKYYLYHQPTKTIRFLFNSWQAMTQYDLATMTTLEVPTSDGLTELCYLTNPGRPVSQPPPMVLLVHGGPGARDYWGFDTEVQFLANRGYAVLQCNYRGSTGFGKSYHNAGYGEWSRKMHTDLIDAVDAAVLQGLADPQKVAIMGASYGGYAALVGVTKTPDVFACGVDIVGPANLFTLMKTIPPYWESYREDFILKIGDPDTLEGRAMMRESSPTFFVDNIVKPLLVAQGANDPRVNKNESEQIVRAMKDKGLPVTYVSFPDEGHGFHKSANQKPFYGVVEMFLESCLGGNAEPLLDLGKSSMVIEEEGDLQALAQYKTDRSFGRNWIWNDIKTI